MDEGALAEDVPFVMVEKQLEKGKCEESTRGKRARNRLHAPIFQNPSAQCDALESNATPGSARAAGAGGGERAAGASVSSATVHLYVWLAPLQ